MESLSKGDLGILGLARLRGLVGYVGIYRDPFKGGYIGMHRDMLRAPRGVQDDLEVTVQRFGFQGFRF